MKKITDMTISRSLQICMAFMLVQFSRCPADAQTQTTTDAQIQLLGQVAFTEGPAWNSDGSVYFSDIENNRIMRMDTAGVMHVYRSPSGRANGLVFDHQGRLIACEGGRDGGNRRVTRTQGDGTIMVLADQYEGKRFNSPNDVTLDSVGNIYFTDPRYGDRSDVQMLDELGRAIEAVYRIAPDGAVLRILSDEVMRPNGIAISPDDRFLFVADNANDDHGFARKLWRFELSASREIVPDSRRELFDWGTERGPDGMAVDEAGRLYVAAGLNHPDPPHETASKYQAGIYVISPDDGKLLDIIPVPIDMITNCAFGGPDRKTLFITAGHQLWSVRVETPGFVTWPAD